MIEIYLNVFVSQKLRTKHVMMDKKNGFKPNYLHQGLGGGDDSIHGNAVLLVQDRSRGRGTKLVHSNGSIDPLGPSKGRSSLNRDGRNTRGEDRVLVRLRLLLKELPAGHGHDADLLAGGLELLSGLNSHLELRSGSNNDDIRVGLLHDGVGSLHGSLDGGGVHVGHSLPGEDKGGRPLDSLRVLGVSVLHGSGVGSSGLVSITRADGQHVRHGTEGGQVLDRLMGRSVLSQSNRVVGHHVDNTGLRKGRHTHGIPHVIREDEEGSAVRDKSRGVKSNSVADGSHGVLAHSKADVALSRGILLEVSEHLHEGHVGRGQIGGSSNKSRDDRGEGVQHGLGVETGGEPLVLRGELRESISPVSRKLSGGDAVELSPLLGVLGSVVSSQLVPGGMSLLSTLSEGSVELIVGLLRHLELTIRPLQVLAGGGGLIRSEWGSVDIVGIGLVRGSVSDEGGNLDQGRLVRDSLGILNGGLDSVKVVVSIGNVLHVPSHGLVTGADILSERDLGVSVDGDTVVIVEGDELSESPVSSKGSSLRGNSLHVASISHDDVGVVVHEVHAWLVEAGSKVLLSEGKSNSVGNSLSERSGGHLNSLGQEVLRVSRGLGSPLAEGLEVLNGQVISHQVEEGVVKHGSVSSGEDETVTLGPLRVAGVGLHELLEEHIRHRGATHRETRVSRVGLVDTVDGQETDGYRNREQGGCVRWNMPR